MVELQHHQRFDASLAFLLLNDSTRTFINRSKIIQEMRNYLNQRGYLEVETPMMHQQLIVLNVTLSQYAYITLHLVHYDV
jgi:lysyl-tRNA synthetase class II